MSFCESKWPNGLEGEGQCPPFSIPAERIPRCIFRDSSSNQLNVTARTSRNSYNTESKRTKWPWRSRSTTSTFNTIWEYPRMHVRCKFGDSNPNLWRVIVRTSQISYNSESKMTKMNLKIRVNDLHFQYQPRVLQDACLVHILWF